MTTLHPEVASAMARAMWARYKVPTFDRFWSKVDKKGEDECWPWKAGKNNRGYGVFALEHPHHNERVVDILAHRYSWQEANGPIPKGRYILNKCDNPPCVNPKHLRVGTLKDNSEDMYAKGRARIGESHPSSKLTEAQVLEIRQKYSRGVYGYTRLAKEYGVAHWTILSIIRRKNWKQV